MQSTGSAPLAGIRVIEVDNWMAAPSCAAMLADLGADVIKIEPVTGDPMRGIGRPAKVEDEALKSYDFQFDVDNRGKRSIAVALDQQAGGDVARRLCESADIFLCNLLPQRQERFGLEPDRLMGLNPRLIHATLTGYGTTGPEATRPGFDVTAFFGRSGIYDGMREGENGIVPNARNAQGDHTTGLALLSSILVALRMVEQTGVGQIVETSLYETAVWTQASDFATAAVDRAPLRKRARNEQIVVTTNRFACADGRWLVVHMPGQTKGWPLLCKALGLEHLLEEERYDSIRGRYRNMVDLLAEVDERFLTRTRDEWGEIFDAQGVVWGPVLAVHETAADPQAEAIGLFPTMEHPEHGTYRTVRMPMRITGADIRPRGPAPTVGEHTRDVLADAGFDETEIAALIEANAIA